MSLRHLHTLLCVHQAKSFQEAAERLHITQSAVSMQLKAMEAEFGVKLFDRSRRPPALTSAGLRLLGPAEDIVSRYEALKRLARTQAPLEGPLVLGVIPTAIVQLMPQALKAIYARHAEAQIQIKSYLSEALIRNVQSGSLDAALITLTPPVPVDVRVSVIYREEFFMVGLRKFGRNLNLSQLAEIPFIRFERRTGIGALIDALLVNAGIVPNDMMELDTLRGITTMVDEGFGVAILPERSLPDNQDGIYTIAPCTLPATYREIALITRNRPETEMLHQAFFDVLAGDMVVSAIDAGGGF